MLLAGLAFTLSCSKDKKDDDDASPFIGAYVISSAKLSDPLVLTTNEIGAYSVPAGTEITIMIQEALMSAVTCSASDKSRIELREDNTLYLTCEGESNELNAGTWEEVSSTSLKLNMNSTAIPNSPTGIVLEVTGIVIANSVLKGNTSVPLPREMLAVMIAQLSYGAASLDIDATPEAVLVNFEIEFLKK
jgi:hypothetical protein